MHYADAGRVASQWAKRAGRGGRHAASCIRHILVVLFSRTQNSANIFYFPPLKIAPMLRLAQPHLLLLLLRLVAVVALVVGRMWVAIFVVSLCCRRRRCLCLCWKERRIIGSFTRSPSQRLVQLTHRQREQEKGKEEEKELLRACVARWLRKWIRVLFSAFCIQFFCPAAPRVLFRISRYFPCCCFARTPVPMVPALSSVPIDLPVCPV